MESKRPKHNHNHLDARVDKIELPIHANNGDSNDLDADMGE